MAEPFERRTSSAGGMLGRLRGARGRTSAIREIEQLLARAGRLCDVTPGQVAAVAQRHGVDLEQRLRTGRLGLYKRFFEHCLLDQCVSREEAEDLGHLRSLLNLAPADVARAHAEVAESVYGDAIDRVLEDHQLDPEEAEFLRQLRSELDLPEEVAERLYSEGEGRAQRRFLDRAIRRDDVLLTARDVTLELSGDSDAGLEAAVRGAIEKACRAVEGLRRVEVTHIGVEVEEGRVADWHVKLQAKRGGDE